MKKFLLLVALAAPITSFTVPYSEPVFSSDEQDQMEIAAYSTYRSGKDKLDQKKMGERLQKTLNTLVKFTSHHLMRRGHIEGKTMLAKWEKNYSKVFLYAEIGVDDIGDHEAIQFILDLYSLAEKYLGRSFCEASHIRDLWVVAYAVPVVFHPARVDIDGPEYKLHFVPFSKALGYWIVMGGCTIYNWIGTPITTLICSPIGEAGRFAFGLLADPLSDAIWKGFHGKQVDPENR